ncbi:MAG: alanine racemase [Bacteroidales bacterium]|nr:alanine racemase [Bacteroidales bacterium]MDD2425540.1 alanine racemase [Bacteroidales bacterium]MDD3989999.1 alanine racemase [Bacteroidales bacterium]MDD4638183.1 alanine racemase [Bacteroidales bacterium]
MITKPTLLLDKNKCLKNIGMMCLKAKRHNLIFRPHFKTHQSLEVGRWFKDFGVERITVSSLEMARYFSCEWSDITVAFPVNILEFDTINELSEKISLNLLVESAESAGFLAGHLKFRTGFFLKIDTGYHRTGISPANTELIDEILRIAGTSGNLDFKGFLTHAGNTYQCRTREETSEVHDSSLEMITSLKSKYSGKYPDLIISVGDTPGCSVSENFKGVDEIRPGNFVFYDLMQLYNGSCTEDQIAVALACPVVAIHKERNEIVIYGGGVHFSKERIEIPSYGIIYGQVAEEKYGGWGKPVPGMIVKSLSQEHGIVSVPASFAENYSIGDVINILPVHSCMTVSAMKATTKILISH